MDLVSIITPTTSDRQRFIDRLVGLIDKQDYPHIEHIIIEGPGTIGEKLNAGCSAANGQIIIRFDSDDIYAHDYVSISVQALQDCDLTGLSSAYFSNGVYAWRYDWKSDQQYVIGSGSAFRKISWESNRFHNTSSGEDRIFCVNAGIIKPHNYIMGFIAQIHSANTASGNSLPYMQQVPMSMLPQELFPALLEVS